MKTLHHHHRRRPANLNAAHFSGCRPASGRERRRLNDALHHCGPQCERSSELFSSPPQRNLERGNVKVPHLGLIQMTSWWWSNSGTLTAFRRCTWALSVSLWSSSGLLWKLSSSSLSLSRPTQETLQREPKQLDSPLLTHAFPITQLHFIYRFNRGVESRCLLFLLETRSIFYCLFFLL